ncbi:LOW QUALITY PROTEIN: hypothetical protein RJ640_001451, partial [Escallonia rubra]
EASNKYQCEKRNTINGDDILWAITNLGFSTSIHLNTILTRDMINVPKQLPLSSSNSNAESIQTKLGFTLLTNNVYSFTNLMPQSVFVSNDQSYLLLPSRL